jgi:type IV pilus assembly protein PilO
VTNLSPDQPAWARRFTRERLLFGLPMLLGGLLAAALLLIVGWPRWGSLQQQQQRLEALLVKQASLPLLEQQLAKAEQQERTAQEQQSLLVDLLAGQGQIRTFLAELSRAARATGVEIELYEPVPAKPEVPATKGAAKPEKGKADKAAKPPSDPLEALGYAITSVLLQVRGSYPSVLAFLRRMESLDLLVRPSDLELNGVESATKDTAGADEDTGPVLTELKLRLSFYDTVPPKAQKANEAKAETPPS